MKAMAIDHAVAAGFGRGEWGGMYSSIRTFTMIFAPLIYGWAYARGNSATASARSFVGLPWMIVAGLGANVPELLHRTLSDEALKVSKITAEREKTRRLKGMLDPNCAAGFPRDLRQREKKADCGTDTSKDMQT